MTEHLVVYSNCSFNTSEFRLLSRLLNHLPSHAHACGGKSMWGQDCMCARLQIHATSSAGMSLKWSYVESCHPERGVILCSLNQA